MNNRKRIALLTSQLEEKYQSEYVKGFLNSAFRHDYDVCVFATFQKEPSSEAKGIGDGNIFSLINYDKFDAVVVMPDTIRINGLMMELEKNLKEKFHGKVLFIDKESKTFPSILIDHYDPIYRLVAHLIEDHGFTRITFLNGYKYHSHSKQREAAYRDCMKAHGLEVQEEDVVYGDYWYYSGSEYARMLLDSSSLPQATVCANDYMALGLAEELTNNGLRIPEDIAIVGYDSIIEGQTSPQPLTSVPLPAEAFGHYSVECVDALFHDAPFPMFNHKEPIFVGSSCGCHCESLVPKIQVREKWAATNTVHSFFNSFRNLTEDLILQTSFHGLMDQVQTYTYQIREFESFQICLNDVWQKEATDINQTEIHKGFTDDIMYLLHCGPSGKGADRLDYNTTFKTSEMLPEMYENCDYPRAFFFSPLFFEDISFGYACISYGKETKIIDEAYQMWLKSVMTGLECYRRNAVLRQRNVVLEDQNILDPLTEMFNYAGFTKHAKPMIERSRSADLFISILAIDLSGLERINNLYGRKEGDQAIYELSKIILDSADEGAMCCRLGNDEFILAELAEDASQNVIHEVFGRISDRLENYNSNPLHKYQIKIYSGKATAKVDTLSAMEDLVNAAVSDKNGNKSNEQKMRFTVHLTPAEEKQAELVKRILDENLFTYHFQPIVDAHNGSIFAYEALMRAKIQPFVSPLEVLQFATHLDRLYDVEKSTFINVLKQVTEDADQFNGKKVFINSIPGITLAGDDSDIVNAGLKNLYGSIVVELTEQTEADDQFLSNMKKTFSDLGVETAVDDYGTGYSNIVNLLRYMPDYVKIDRMLLSGIQDNPQKQHFVKDIVIFAHENNFKVLAEGIETTEELETVIQLNVDLIQGYYTARPKAEIVQEISETVKDEIILYNKKVENAR